MEIKLHPFELSLKYPFSISRHTYHSVKTMIVELKEGSVSGYGEATANPYYHVTMENLSSVFRQCAHFLENYNFENPAKLWHDLQSVLMGSWFAQSALDCAAYDLFGKLTGQSLLDIWKTSQDHFPVTSYTLGIDPVEKMLHKMLELPWPVYKVKMGSPDDLHMITELRKNTGSLFRVDANCAWNPDHTVQMSGILKDLGVELIEQPLLPEEWKGMKHVHERSVLPVFADESCQVPGDVEKCSGYFHGVNIKLAKCGGLTPALTMIQEAKKLGNKIMIGCMTETSVGMAAAGHLLGVADYADLDGPLLLAEDVANAISYKNGSVVLSGENGLGIQFHNRKIQPLLY